MSRSPLVKLGRLSRDNEGAAHPDAAGKGLSRRSFLRGSAATAATAAAATACAPPKDWEKWFQQHYKELSDEDKAAVFDRLRREQKEKYSLDVDVRDPPPREGVRFAFALDLNRCNGNRRCVEACVKENNQSRDPPIEYIQVLELDAGTFHLGGSDRYFDGLVPKDGKVYLPVQCNQCDDPPCTKSCPVEATWKEKDGIVVIDYDWCIGCRYCMAACPYEARHFNYREPKLDRSEVNTDQGYLSNRPRPRGVVEKCHFCLHRTRLGQYPACLEACPTGARIFGDINDPQSEVSQVLKHKRVFVLKEELNTVPHFFYFFG